MTNDNIATIQRIELARDRISSKIFSTPLVKSQSLSSHCGTPVFLKLEHHQRTGSFKVRGAINAIQNLTKVQIKAGVVGFSTGNHGRGLAYAARAAGVRCIICMSELVPKNKIEGIISQGAEVRIVGKTQDDAQLEVNRLVEEEGMVLIPPFDHLDIIAGQGTLGLEIADQLPEISTAVVPVSGGGLISGVALALKDRIPDCRVIGVSMERGAAMFLSQKAGQPILVAEEETLADSLGGGIGLDNKYTFKMTKELVEDIVLVSENDIAMAIRHAYWHEAQIIEGSGAVAIAALISNKVKTKGLTVAFVCGGNIDMALHHRVIS